MRIFGWIVLFVLTIAGCSNRTPDGPLVFFDLKEFLAEEQLRLGGHSDVSKTVEVNGTSETKELKAYDWQSEMALLNQWDINRPAWRDQYQRDTILDGQKSHIRYQSLDDKLQVQSMDIWQSGSQMDSILILTKVDNPLRTTRGIYRYQPAGGLAFSQVSSRLFGSEQNLKVTLELMPFVDR